MKFPEYEAGSDLADRRQHLNRNIQWLMTKGANPKLALYSLAVIDGRSGRAQALLKAVIDNWLEVTGPPADSRARLEKSLEANELQAKDLSLVIDGLKKRPDLLMPDVKNGYLPLNIGEMIKMRTETEGKVEDLKEQLKTKSRDLIFEAPDLPTRPSGPRKVLIVGISAIVALGALIAYVLLLRFLQTSAGRPAYAPFFKRIDQAIYRRRTPG